MTDETLHDHGDGAPPDEKDALWDRALEEAFTRTPGAGAPPAFASGPRGGRFRILGEIARGGMGAVYRAHDEWLRRDVALKIMRTEYLGQPDALERFLDEAQVGGQLQHPGIVPIHDVGVDGSNRPFICMELVRGRTLASLLSDRTDPSVDRGRFVTVFEQVCQTLAYAHSRGVIHRDLKPSNVMVGAFGEVRVVDWGFAKVRGERVATRPGHERAAPPPGAVSTARSGSEGPASTPGSVLGTPGYMAPEQARGEVDAIDERSDVFALGAMLCEILTGQRPFVAEDGTEPLDATRAGRLDAAFARLAASNADPDLVRLARRCLDPHRESRPHDAGQVARAIADHHARSTELSLAAGVEAAEARGRAAEAERSRRFRVAGWVVVAVCVVAVACVVGWALYERQQAARERDQERSIQRAADDGMLRSLLEEFDRHVAAEHWGPAVETISRALGVRSAGHPSPELADQVDRAAERLRTLRPEPRPRPPR